MYHLRLDIRSSVFPSRARAEAHARHLADTRRADIVVIELRVGRLYRVCSWGRMRVQRDRVGHGPVVLHATPPRVETAPPEPMTLKDWGMVVIGVPWLIGVLLWNAIDEWQGRARASWPRATQR
jgi:hypothetical protein